MAKLITNLLLTLLCTILFSSFASGACLNLIKGPILFDAGSCKKLEPTQFMDFKKEKFKWINDLDLQGKNNLLNSYRGILVKGLVVESRAKNIGLDTEQGALKGKEIYVYMPPNTASCSQVANHRISGKINEICCEGGGNAPCLLNTSYVFQANKIVGKTASADGHQKRIEARKNPAYKKASKAFKNKKWQLAAKYFEKAKQVDKIDLLGLYKLSMSYRNLDLCKKANPILKNIFERRKNDQIWGDEVRVAKNSTFLLARCYARERKASEAKVVLDSFLLEPSVNKAEIKRALKHKDFGYISTSKEYLEFKEAAEKALKTP